MPKKRSEKKEEDKKGSSSESEEAVEEEESDEEEEPEGGEEEEQESGEEDEEDDEDEEEEEDEGNIAKIRAKFSADKKRSTVERRKRNRAQPPRKAAASPSAGKKAVPAKEKKRVRIKEEPVILNGRGVSEAAEATKKAKRQPSDTPDEKADKALGEYIYGRLKAVLPDAEMTQRTAAVLSDLVKNHAAAVVARAQHFSTSTGAVHGAKRPISHAAMWGAVRTLLPPELCPVALLNSISLVAAVKDSAEKATAAWEAYTAVPEDALDNQLTQNMIEDM